jgi:membrane protease YdiL (CAAX protease family)
MHTSVGICEAITHPQQRAARGEGARARSHRTFFAVVFALSLPFWLLGAVSGGRLPLPMHLSVSSLSVVTPLLAALILVRREEGAGAVRKLLRDVLDPRRVKPTIWYVPALLSMPLIMVLSYALMRLVGRPLPEDPRVPFLAIPVLFVVFFVAAVGEETGWTGYAISPLQGRWRALKSSLMLGSVWALWHLPLFVEAHYGLAYIVWQSFFLVAARVLIVWLFDNTGGAVIAAILFHDTINVSEGLFPNGGSHYDPLVTAAVTALAAAIVTLVWGASTLASRRSLRSLPKLVEEVS